MPGVRSLMRRSCSERSDWTRLQSGAPAKLAFHAPWMKNTSTRLKTQPKFWGLVTRRERWSLSWRGWLAVVVILLITAFGFTVKVYPYFAITERVDTRLLAVEGWINPYAIRAAAKEARSQ